MQIAESVFIRWKLTSAARLALMGLCSLTLYLILSHYLLASDLAFVMAVVAGALFIAAIIVLLRKPPTNRNAEVAPHLVIPAPLFYGGLNTANEPFTYWKLFGKKKAELLFITNQRTGFIRQRWFTLDEWNQLLEHLPQLEPLPKNVASHRLSIPVLTLAAICLLIHFSPLQLTNVTPFNYLIAGAHSWPLALDGQVYRLLSSAWVHGNNAHLYLNVISLVVLADALRNSFSAKCISALLIVSAITSVALGSLATSMSIALGASGAIMGLFGFLFAAQRKTDQRLHPINRIARQKLLYLLLAMELILSLSFSWYGGTVHLAGFATGYAYYHGFEAKRPSYGWISTVQSLILLVGLGLFTFWLIDTYKTYKQPKTFIARVQKLEDPVLTALSSAALPDLLSATPTEVIAAKRNALAHLAAEEMNSLAIARSDHWLGNTDTALASLRKSTAAYPRHDMFHPMWLAVERDAAKQAGERTPITVLPAGNATTYLISTDYQHVARLRLRALPTPLGEISAKLARHSWFLTGTTDQDAPGSYGIWRMTETHFPTQASASLAQ